MQFTIATIAMFSSTVLALPYPATTTISFINDQSGANAAIVAPLDGSTINLYNRLAGSPIGRSYQILASSAQFTHFTQNAACIISGISTTALGELNAKRTWTKLNPLNQPGVALVDLNGATMRCTATGNYKRQVMLDDGNWFPDEHPVAGEAVDGNGKPHHLSSIKEPWVKDDGSFNPDDVPVGKDKREEPTHSGFIVEVTPDDVNPDVDPDLDA